MEAVPQVLRVILRRNRTQQGNCRKRICGHVSGIPRQSAENSLSVSRGRIVRSFHFGSPRLEGAKTQQQQVHPLGAFYSDLLATPIPTESKARTELPNFVDTGGDLTKEERAAKLFGNIRGSGYERTTSDTPDATWRTINGVPVPPRPGEPENCCMSGCAHCVWDDYRDDVESWAARVREAQAKGAGDSHQVTPKIEMNRPEVTTASGSMDDDGGGSEALWAAPSAMSDENALFADIPVGIREFMAAEKRIRDRKKAGRATATL